MTTADILTTIIAIGGAGLGSKMLVVLIETRDSIRDHIRDVGVKEPVPTGLFKQVSHLESVVEIHDSALAELGFERRSLEQRRIIDRDRAGQ